MKAGKRKGKARRKLFTLYDKRVFDKLSDIARTEGTTRTVVFGLIIAYMHAFLSTPFEDGADLPDWIVRARMRVPASPNSEWLYHETSAVGLDAAQPPPFTCN
jgi:hypothetical protein